MKPIIVHGDITAIENLAVFNPQALNSVSQCVNCMGVMGRGLALSIKNKYPIVYSEYMALCTKHKNNRSKLLGHVQPVSVNELTTYCNIFGQFNYGTDKRQVNYEAIFQALEYQAQVAKNTPQMDFYYPLNMGAGLAGGSWLVIESMMTSLFSDLPNKVYFVNFSK